MNTDPSSYLTQDPQTVSNIRQITYMIGRQDPHRLGKPAEEVKPVNVAYLQDICCQEQHV